VLDDAAREAARRLGGGTALPLEGLRELRPALARLLLQRAAAAAAGRPVSLSPDEAGRILALGGRGGSAALDLPGGLRAVGEYGMLRFAVGPDAPPPDPVPLPVPGSARFGAWEVEAREGRGGEVVLSGPALGKLLTVRAWREGDRMRPSGLGGGKSLQDLFTDRKVPRALRRTLPVVEAAQGIAWVAGVATGEQFLAREGERDVVSLAARRGGAPADRATSPS
jgi:tRNA(Ile)-lysidine synthase